ncbi:Lrp/AsnC family transcriptional regulator [archaeon]|nr:Lrp/AsnC family transcriptional regulator [archaeon]
MDTADRKILTFISESLPIDEQPFRFIAEQTGISEDEVVDRIRELKNKGIIRRIGAVISPKRLGWHSTLCAVNISEGRIEEYAEVVNSFQEVTHNYVRSGEPNCWFTLIAPTKERSGEIIREISRRLQVEVLDLPAERTFKIKVSFTLEDQ